jgi:hypothetical protein
MSAPGDHRCFLRTIFAVQCVCAREVLAMNLCTLV